MTKLIFKFFQIKKKGKKRLFLFYGSLNFLITNLVLQLLLFITPIYLATILSQITNLVIGFYLYGKRVFKLKNLNLTNFRRYIFLATFNWFLNFLSISIMYENGINKNLAAIIALPFLVAISYYFQKNYIYKTTQKILKLFNIWTAVWDNVYCLLIFFQFMSFF